jgi:osmotically-inducible protein OsmY
MTALLSKADHDLQRAVREELAWIPELLDAPPISVGVSEGAVTLTGSVDSQGQRLAAKRAALRVRGARSVVDRLDVASDVWNLADADVAAAVQGALAGASVIPEGVQTQVKHGAVVLTGEVQWDHQRRSAERIALWVKGVKSVDNRITLSRRPSATDTAERIRHALVRNAIIDANAIEVETVGTTVILRGSVRTWLEKSQAARTAWASPHVTEVDNRIVIEEN